MGSPHVTDGQDVDQCLLAVCFYHQDLHPPMLCLSRLGGMKSIDLKRPKDPGSVPGSATYKLDATV